MNTTVKNICNFLVALTGLGLLFIGARFFISPGVAEHQYGIDISTGDLSFHYIKGIRDIFSGIILLVLLFAREYRALGLILLCAVIIPATDFCIVYMHQGFDVAKLSAHFCAIAIAVGLGIYYFLNAGHLRSGQKVEVL
jgi:uncharacterized membrane protein